MSVTFDRRLLLVTVVIAPAIGCSLLGCAKSAADDPQPWYTRTMVENFGGHTMPAPNAPVTVAQDGTPLPPPPTAGTAITTAAVAPTAIAPNTMTTAAVAPPPGAPAMLPAGPPMTTLPPGAMSPAELYQSENSCGMSAARTLPGPPGDVALGMTECEVARRAGLPDRVQLLATPDGSRGLTLSYLRGPRPRIYHFAAGRLVEIENLPEPRLRVPPRSRGT